MKRSHLGTALRIAVTLGLLWLLFRLVGVESVVQEFQGTDTALLLAGIAICLVDRVLMVGKWFPLLKAQAPAIRLGRAARAYLASGFASLLLPATVGGDVLRAVALGRGRKLVVEVGASIAIERLFGMMASAVYVLVALVLAISNEVALHILIPWALTALGVSLLFTLVTLSPTLSAWAFRPLERFGYARRFAAALALYRGHGKMLAVFGVLCLIEQAFPILSMWVFGKALGIDIDLPVLFVAVPLVMFVARLPIALNGLGPAEGAYVYLLGLFGVAPAAALALAIAGRLGELVGVIPGAFFWADLAGHKDTPCESE